MFDKISINSNKVIPTESNIWNISEIQNLQFDSELILDYVYRIFKGFQA